MGRRKDGNLRPQFSCLKLRRVNTEYNKYYTILIVDVVAHWVDVVAHFVDVVAHS